MCAAPYVFLQVHTNLQPAKAEQSKQLGLMPSADRDWRGAGTCAAILAVVVLERMTHPEVELCVSRLH
jgi:hypothetical protein